MLKPLLQRAFDAVFIKTRSIMAFTLAEVLITLTIIGIIASLTIPGVVNDTNKAQYVSKLKKEYSVLSQAYSLIAMDAGGSILNDSNFNSATGDNPTDANAMNEFATKINVIKNCGNGIGCLYNSPRKLLGGDITNDNYDSTYNGSFGKAIQNDGVMVVVNINGTSCNTTSGSTSGSPLYGTICGDIQVDINGSSVPNQFGRDIFWFWITKTGIYPKGTFNDGTSCDISGSTGCAGKVLTDGAMNY